MSLEIFDRKFICLLVSIKTLNTYPTSVMLLQYIQGNNTGVYNNKDHIVLII